MGERPAARIAGASSSKNGVVRGFPRKDVGARRRERRASRENGARSVRRTTEVLEQKRGPRRGPERLTELAGVESGSGDARRIGRLLEQRPGAHGVVTGASERLERFC